MAPNAAKAPRLQVYVSFCGADTEFAHKLIDELKADSRFDVSFDPDTEIDEDDWKDLIGSLILDADAVVHIVSPEAAETCGWEAEFARENSKQVLLAQCRPLGGTALPTALQGLKSIRFDGPQAFTRPYKALVSKLAANNGWLREHTRLLNRARNWEDAGCQTTMLLAGDEVMDAKLWTLSRPDDAPKPTDLHIRFISTSEAADTARRVVVEEAEADQDEIAALEQLQAPVEGFRRFANQAYMVASLWLAVLVLVSQWQTAEARKQATGFEHIATQTCGQQPLLVSPTAPPRRTAEADRKCVNDDLLCSRLGR